MNFVGTNIWCISDKDGIEFHDIVPTKSDAIEECRRRGGGFVGQLYKVNFGIGDALGWADKVINNLYEKLYGCVESQADDWNVTEKEKEELDLKLGKVIIDFINEKQLQPNNYCYVIFDIEKVE